MPDDRKAVFKIIIKGSIHDVWKEITRTDAPIAAFFNSRMHLTNGMLSAGSKLAMRTPDGKYTGVVGEVLEVRPPTRFSHTFRFTNLDDPPCRVTYDLKDLGASTEFMLTIDDLPVGTKTAKQMTSGGKMIINTLKNVIQTGRPSLGTRMLFVLFKLMGPLTPKKCLSEHWKV